MDGSVLVLLTLDVVEEANRSDDWATIIGCRIASLRDSGKSRASHDW